MGIIAQRAALICILFAALIILAWTQLERLLLLLGQEATLSTAAARYIHLSSPALIVLTISNIIRCTLTAQLDILPCTGLSIVTTLLTPLLNWLLIYHWELRLDGAAWANVAEACIYFLLLAGYFLWRESKLRQKGQHTLQTWSLEPFRGWGAYLSIALPGLAMTCLEWWTYEVIVIMAGLLPDVTTSVAVMGVSFDITTITYMLPSGISEALETIMSNHMGAGNARAARMSLKAALGVGTATVFVTATAVFAGRSLWPKIFTPDSRIVALASSVLVILAVASIFDGIMCIFRGAVTALGRQSVGAAFAFGCYWCVGIPLAILLGFRAGLGVQGLWLALLVASALGCGAMAVFLGRLDWDKEALRIATSMAEDGITEAEETERLLPATNGSGSV
ncbi:g3858 [Coccomyxa elongata]